MPITLIGLLMTFVLQPKVMQLSNLYEQQEYLEFHRIVRKLAVITFNIGIVILLATYVIGAPALGLIFGVDFAPYKSSLMIVVAGGVINALVSVFINVLIIVRRFKYQFYILLVTNFLLAILSASIVKAYGLIGSVWLFSAINLVQATLLIAEYSFTLRKVKNAIK
jgi:O-antigen/teichoic acid export membrane protein